jgi:hypothetical protein
MNNIKKVPVLYPASLKPEEKEVSIPIIIYTISNLIYVAKITNPKGGFLLTPKFRIHRLNAYSILNELERAGYSARTQTIEEVDSNLIIVDFYLTWNT